MGRLRDFLDKKLLPRLELPAAEIILHLIVTVLSILSIAGIEGLLRLSGLDRRLIPATTIQLGDWMFGLEVVAATAIILIGIGKAIYALLRSGRPSRTSSAGPTRGCDSSGPCYSISFR